MTHPLDKNVTAVRRQIRRLIVVRGLAWAVVAVLGAALVFGLADYLIRFQDPGIRLIGTLLAVALLVWSSYRYLVVPSLKPFPDIDIAQRIERRFPQLADQFSSSVEFLKQSEDDPEAGSAALRRAVITDATVKMEDFNLTTVVDRRPTWQAVKWAGAICLLVALMALFDVFVRAYRAHPTGDAVGSSALAKSEQPRPDKITGENRRRRDV